MRVKMEIAMIETNRSPFSFFSKASSSGVRPLCLCGFITPLLFWMLFALNASAAQLDDPDRPAAVDAKAPQRLSVLDISARRELFVDHHLIDQMEGLRMVLHHPTRQEVAIKFDQPWEGNTSGYVTVMRDGERLKMIYCGHRMIWDGDKLRMSHSPVVCYAESRDGIQWTKPHLRLFPWRGKDADKMVDPLANNIVWPGSSESGTFVPFLDGRPGCPPNEKFKAVGGNYKIGLYLFTSADAIHWKKSKQAVFKRGALDSMNVVFWEPKRRKYVIYYRTVSKRLRSVSMAESPDLTHWSNSKPLSYPDSPPQQMYTNQISPYYRAPHIRIGFPTRYTARKLTSQLRSLPPVKLRAELTAAYARVGSDLTDGMFMTSRDGVQFHRWDEAFMRPGPQASALASRWMYGDNYQNYGLFETPSAVEGAPNDISMLFGEGYWRDGKSQLRRYSIRLDGFVSLQAPFRGGELITKPLRFSGEQLSINYATSAAGSVRVELQTPDGRAISGYRLDECPEFIGDHVDHIVHWKQKKDVTQLIGQTVRLRIVMKDADLYSLQFKSRARQTNRDQR